MRPAIIALSTLLATGCVPVDGGGYYAAPVYDPGYSTYPAYPAPVYGGTSVYLVDRDRDSNWDRCRSRYSESYCRGQFRDNDRRDNDRRDNDRRDNDRDRDRDGDRRRAAEAERARREAAQNQARQANAQRDAARAQARQSSASEQARQAARSQDGISDATREHNRRYQGQGE